MKFKFKFLTGLITSILAACSVQQHELNIENAESLFSTPNIVFDPTEVNKIENECERIAFVAADNSKNENPDIYFACRDGSQLVQLTDDPAADLMPAWSPDGTQIAFASSRLDKSHIFLINVDDLIPKQLTLDYINDWPVWLPDGKTVAFRTTDGNGLWWWRRIDLSNHEIENITEPNYDFFFQKLSWSPDGKQIAYMSLREQNERNDGSSQIHIMDNDGSNDYTLLENIWANILPEWSPDGKQIAFLSEMNGQYNNFALYLINLDGTGLRKITDEVYSDTSTSFSWSSEGKTIAISDNGTGKITFIDINGNSQSEFKVENNIGQLFWPAWQPKIVFIPE